MSFVAEVELIQPALVEKSTTFSETLPPFLIEDIVPMVEDAEVLEPVIQKAVSVSSPSTNGDVIPETPTLPPLSIEDIVPVDEDVEMLKQIILEETFGVIPETPTLLTIDEFLPCENVELVEPVILKEQADVWSLIAEIDEIILESSTIPSPQIEPMTLSALPLTTEITEIIPDAPTLLSLPKEGIAPVVEEVKIVKPKILEDTVGVIPETPTVTATEQLVPCEEAELAEPVILEESVEKIIHDAPTLSPISIKNVDLLIKDILLQKPDILEELKKLFPEFDRAITEPSTLTSLLIGEIYLKEPILKEYADVFASDPETIIFDEDIPVEEEILIDPCTGLKEPAYYMSNTSETFIIPEAPKISFTESPCALVENTNLEYMDFYESTIITEPVLKSDKAEYFLPEQFPLNNGEEFYKDVIMGDSAEMFPNQERTRLEHNNEPSVANSTALDKVSQGNSYQKTKHPGYVPVPTNDQEVFNYGPIIPQLSTPKPKSLNNMLVKGRSYRFRTNPYPKISLKEQTEHNNKVPLFTSYDIVSNRISPNRSLK